MEQDKFRSNSEKEQEQRHDYHSDLSQSHPTYHEEEPEKIDLFKMLSGFFQGARVLWPLLIILTLALGTLGYYRSYRSYSPQYESEATFTVRAAYGADNYDYYNNSAASALAKVFPYLLTSTQLSELVTEDLGLTSLPGTIKASVTENTNLFHLTVRGSDPEMTYKLLNSVIENYPEIAKKVIGNTELEMVSYPVVAESPINPFNGVKQALRLAIIGFALACCIIFLYGSSRQTVKDEDSLKAYTHLRCLGTVKHVKQKKHRKIQSDYNFVNGKKVDYGFREAYRSISSRLERRMKEEGHKVLMVTSTLAGEGKTTSAINLALSMADEADKRIILIDGDLRKPSTTSAILKEGNAKSTVYDVLEGKISLEEALIPWGESGIYLLAGDERTFEQASEIASSNRLSTLIEEARNIADYVIVDTSPMDMMADAYSIGHYVDGIVMIVRYAYANRNYILNAMRRLDSSGTPIYGYLINGTENSPLEHRNSYYGSYSSYHH